MPATVEAFTAGQNYSIKVISESLKKNSEPARIAARAKKIEDMKEIKEFTLEIARSYLAKNPNFGGSRNALMVQIKPDVDKRSKTVRRKTTSESTITSYLKEFKLP
jgi:hypothetical protein